MEETKKLRFSTRAKNFAEAKGQKFVSFEGGILTTEDGETRHDYSLEFTKNNIIVNSDRHYMLVPEEIEYIDIPAVVKG